MRQKPWLVLASLCFALAACGGGGGGGGGGTTGSVAGTLAVAASNKRQIEPNDTLAEAQTVAVGDSILGDSAQVDRGTSLNVAACSQFFTTQVIDDFYKVTTTQATQIVMTIAADAQDIDLYLFDSVGNAVDCSEASLSSSEVVATPGAGTFYIGVTGLAQRSNYLLTVGVPAAQVATADTIIPTGAEIVPGEVLFKPKASAKFSAQAAIDRAGLAAARELSQGVTLARAVAPAASRVTASKGLSASGKGEKVGQAWRKNEQTGATIDAIRKLRRDPSIEYAEPNFIRRALATPNDPGFAQQWHYPLINLPQAWDVTIGDSGNAASPIIVAVIDTGVLLSHPDLSGQLVAGYDFVSDASRGRDGDGLDANPDDPGDEPPQSSFHGTHVAGTIAAATNNGIGVAGVAWRAKIMPLRVLGAGGGTDADIAEAIYFSARLTNASGTLPTQKADVINMSLGGPGRSTTMQNAVTAARGQGVIFIAAAGNSNSNEFFSPASLDGVVSVSAVDRNKAKAPYSNFGATVDVAAPGGNMRTASADGVLSTLGDDGSGSIQLGYGFLQGTSMASPHMAGVVGLMRSVDRSLSPQDLDSLLAGTHTGTALRITEDLGAAGRDDIFGHGLIKADLAVAAAQALAGGGGPPPTDSIGVAAPTSLDFGTAVSALQVTVSNGGVQTLNVTGATVNQPWVSVAPTTGPAPLRIDVTVNRAGLPTGANSATLTITTDATGAGKTLTVPISVQVAATGTGGDVGTVFVLAVSSATGDTVKEFSATAANGYRYSLADLAPGDYDIVAGTDRDDDGLICEPVDSCGIFRTAIKVTAGSSRSDVDIAMQNQTTRETTARGASARRPR